jgi:hypothetical protein
LRIAPGNRDQIWRSDTKNGKVGFGIIAYAIRSILLTIRKGDTDLFGVMDNVAVGKDEAVRGKHESGACARSVPAAPNVNIDNRRADSFRSRDHGLGIGIQQQSIGNLRRHSHLSMLTDYIFKPTVPAAIAPHTAPSK